jgi:hypothetical protein
MRNPTKYAKLLDQISTARKFVQDQLDSYPKALPRLDPLLGELSDTVDLNPYGGSFWFTVHNREDLQVLLQLAPKWTKEIEEKGIRYTAVVDGVTYWVAAQDAGLPDTCRLVEKEIELPAVAAKTVKRWVVECDPPPAESAAAVNPEAQKSETATGL